MNSPSAQRILQAHGCCDSHRRARLVRREKVRLVFDAFFEPCSVWYEYHLEVCRLVVLEMLDDSLVLLALERRDLVRALFDRFEDVGLLVFGGEQFVRKEALRARDMGQPTTSEYKR